MAGLFRSIKRAFTGQVLKECGFEIMGGHVAVSLKTKRDSGTASDYVQLAFKGVGNHQNYLLEPSELDMLIRTASELRAVLRPPA